MNDNPKLTTNSSTIAAIFTAVLAALSASLCCIGPLVLMALGLGGSWISKLSIFEPYRGIFIVITVLFILMAFRKLYLLPNNCGQNTNCRKSNTVRNQRIIFWLVSPLLIAILTFPYYGMSLL